MTRRREIQMIVVAVLFMIGIYRMAMTVSSSSGGLWRFQIVNKDDVIMFLQEESAIEQVDDDDSHENANIKTGTAIPSNNLSHENVPNSTNTATVTSTSTNAIMRANDHESIQILNTTKNLSDSSPSMTDDGQTTMFSQSLNQSTSFVGPNYNLREYEQSDIGSSSNSTSSIKTSSSSSDIQQRWNGLQLQEILYDPQFNESQLHTSLVEQMPKPYGNDVTIFNFGAWKQLRQLFQTKPTTTICSMGGSISTGVLLRNAEQRQKRWDIAFGDMIKYSFPNTTTHVKVVNRGHGRRESFHSAYLMQSFVPAETDVIIWEFAVNDGELEDCQTMTNGLMLFLNQIRTVAKPNDQSSSASTSTSSSPPLVLLAYYWDSKCFLSQGKTKKSSWIIQENGKVPDSTFQCHQHTVDIVAANYDFVVGSVNLASYMDHLEWKDHRALAKTFLADVTHPNYKGHWLMGYLLWDLVMDEERSVTKRKEQHPTIKTTTNKRAAPYSLYSPCQDDDKQSPLQKQALDLVLQYPTKASWSAEEPHNTEPRPAMMDAFITSYQKNEKNQTMASTADSEKRRNLTIINHAKAAPERVDRKYSVLLPCCSNKERLIFDVGESTSTMDERNKNPSKNLNTGSNDPGGMWISALHMTPMGLQNAAQPRFLTTDFHIEFWNGTRLVGQSPGTIIDTVTTSNNTNSTTTRTTTDIEWTSLHGGKCKVESWSWLLLSESTWVSRVEFCNKLPNCDDGDGGSDRPDNGVKKEEKRSLMHLVVY